MKLAKTLAEYGLLKELDIDGLLQTLGSKVQNLVQLEKTVKESSRIRDKAAYQESFQLIREYVCEFGIHLVYQIQDAEFETNLREGSDDAGTLGREYQFDWLSSRVY